MMQDEFEKLHNTLRLNALRLQEMSLLPQGEGNPDAFTFLGLVKGAYSPETLNAKCLDMKRDIKVKLAKRSPDLAAELSDAVSIASEILSSVELTHAYIEWREAKYGVQKPPPIPEPFLPPPTETVPPLSPERSERGARASSSGIRSAVLGMVLLLIFAGIGMVWFSKRPHSEEPNPAAHPLIVEAPPTPQPPKRHTEQRTEVVAFQKQRVPDDNAEEGVTNVRQAGQNGQAEITEEVIDTPGQPIETHEVSRKIVLAPKDEIVAYGTLTTQEVSRPTVIPIPAPRYVMIASLPPGKKKLKTPGKAGEIILHERVKYRRGMEIHRDILRREVRIAAISPVYEEGKSGSSSPRIQASNTRVTPHKEPKSHEMKRCPWCDRMNDPKVTKCTYCGKPLK